MRVATFNVNSIKARLPAVTAWLDETQPDVALLQEIKCVAEAFPEAPFADRGYNVALAGQKTYNGVAILSRQPLGEVLTALPGDPDDTEARYVEAVLETGLRVASVYVPMGQAVDSDKYHYKLAFLERLRRHVAARLSAEDAFVLGGDYNVAPGPLDVHDETRWAGKILYSLEERAALRRVLNLGLTDAFRVLHPEGGNYTWWDYRGGAWNRDAGLRIDHVLLTPPAADCLTAAGIDRAVRGGEKASDHAPVWCMLWRE